MLKPGPYYHLVPKDRNKNLEFRADLIRLGCSSLQDAEEIWMMCARDLLFYVGAMCWTYDPRKDPSALPFIPYSFQDEALLEIDAAIGDHDLLIEKSRDMGVSWLCLTAMEWRWHFRDLQSFLMVSRKEDYVDKTDDPDSLFWKLDFIHKNQPKWLLPNFTRNKLMLSNADNGSSITGDSTTGDVGRGGRRTAILLDEFASVDNGSEVLAATADATTCRIFNSTPKGTGNAFYERRSCTKTLRLHWTAHPEKAKGLYHSGGKPRSPWYDNECKRRSHKLEIAQELDIDYLGSNSPFFDANVLEVLKRDFAREPYKVGSIIYNAALEVTGFTPGEGGPFSLWTTLDYQGKPPTDRRYSIGVDVAFATGASLSCIAIGDTKTCEKVGEFVTHNMPPHELARVAVALAKWFNGSDGLGAYLIWEANGPGRIFGNQVVELGYRNIYYRQNEKSISKDTTDFPGFWKTSETGLALLGEYARAIATGDFVDRSLPSLQECEHYKFLPNGSVAHDKSRTTEDPSGARDNHGDRVIATALCWRGMKESKQEEKKAAPIIPAGSLADRRRMAEKERKVVYW